ncbi:MAG: hypothetical protein KIT31_29775 [Deltaproteobacteria bacterium]|nr:hypothetical protein [Deltaproteobacteria bacterium]
MKVAVIGSGAAAAGVLAGLEHFAPRAVDVTVFDIGHRFGEVPAGLARDGFTRAQMSPLYRRLRAEHGLAFPPPKSHFGETIRKFAVGGKPRLWKSEHRGGLTNLWGGGMFPFPDRELAGWPVTAADLDRYYQIIAERVGVCGERDALNDFFTRDYVNRPPLRTSPVIEALRDTTNRGGGDEAWRVLAGASRLALETRRGLPRSCTYDGECMLGCPREAIWSARLELDAYERSLIARTVVGRVRRVEPGAVWYRDAAGTDHRAGPFDRIYVAAGCIGSSEIVMRSLGIARGPRMLDNAVVSFPIFYAGGARAGEPGYFSLCNLSMMGIPADPALATAQVSVYPAFDHLFRYYTPEPLWSAMRGLWRLGRWRVLLGRVFFAGAANRALELSLVDDELVIEHGPDPDTTPAVRSMTPSFMAALRRAVNRDGFFIPPITPGGHATSSHYAATFPYGGAVATARDGAVARGVHLADASTFVTAPAISPTFTIMANACRTVHESLLS